MWEFVSCHSGHHWIQWKVKLSPSHQNIFFRSWFCVSTSKYFIFKFAFPVIAHSQWLSCVTTAQESETKYRWSWDLAKLNLLSFMHAQRSYISPQIWELKSVLCIKAVPHPGKLLTEIQQTVGRCRNLWVSGRQGHGFSSTVHICWIKNKIFFIRSFF